MTPLVAPFGYIGSGKFRQVPYQPILGQIVDLVAEPGNGVVVLVWTKPRGTGTFQVQYKEDSSGTWLDYGTPVPFPTITTPGQGFQVQSLTNGVLYDFRVLAIDVHDRATTTSNEVSATPVSSGSGMVVVNDLAFVSATSSSITVEFTQGQDGTGQPAKYNVRYLTTTMNEDTFGTAVPYDLNITTNLAIGVLKQYEITGLTAGTLYNIALKPFRGIPDVDAVFGEISNVVSNTTSGSVTLGTITNLGGAAGNGQVALTWTPAANATSHQPQYKLNSSGTWLDFGSALGASASSVTVTGLSNGSLYDFRIVAGNGVTTTNSNTISRTPQTQGSTGEWRSEEPNDYTPIHERNFNVTIPNGDNVIAEDWWHYYSPDRIGIVDIDTPSGDNKAIRLRIGEGEGGLVGNWPLLGFTFPRPCKEVYYCWDHHYSDNWHYGLVGDKFVYTFYGDLDYWVIGMRADSPTGPGVIQSGGQYPGDENLYQNLSGVGNPRGVWGRYQARLVMNSSFTAHDGQYHAWLNGTKIAEWLDVRYTAVEDFLYFTGMMLTPTVGGAPNPFGPTPSVQYSYHDRFYMSGKNFL